jgi:hypothetical protein
MSSSPPALPALQLPSWLEELWNASSSNATVGQAALISLALAILAALIPHLLTKRRENERWANQNTLHALQRATDAFYKTRQHYGHLLRIDPLDLMLGTFDDSSPPLTAPRDWTPLHEALQRAHEALIDVHLSSGKYRRRVRTLSTLGETVAEKLDETAYETSFITPEGLSGRGGAMKKKEHYFEDAMNAIHDYENAFSQLREDVTADLTARRRTRLRHKFGRWRTQWKQARQTKGAGASTDRSHSADASTKR